VAERAAGARSPSPPAPAASEAARAADTRVSQLALVAVTVVTAIFAVRRLDDFDTWWHLAAGRWIVTNGRVPATDTLSYTVPDHRWVNLQWMYDVMLYGIHQLGGADALVLASAACFIAAVWITLRTASFFSGPILASMIGLWLVLVAEERFFIRPEMVTFLLLAIELRLLLTAKRDEGRRLWWLPLVFLVWVNCHALFVVGAVVLACFVAAALTARAGVLPQQWRRANDLGADATRRLLLASLASAAAVFVNPFFHRGALFPLELLSRIDGSNTAFQAIGEFRSPFSGYFTTWSIGAFQGFFFFALGVMLLAAIAGLSRPRRVTGGPSEVAQPQFHVAGALVVCALAYLSTLARRNIGIFVFGSAPFVAAWLALLADRTGIAHRLQKAGSRSLELASTAAVCLACVALGLFVASNRYYAGTSVTRETGLGVFECNFPMYAAAFAEETKLPSKLYNDLTAGGYLTWKPGVEGGVFIDGRLEVYDTDFFTRYFNAFSDVRLWQQQVDSYGVSTVVLFHRWGNRHPLIRFLARDPAWALVYHDEAAIIFVRRRGNEEAIARASAAFPAWQAKTRERLARGRGWQTPISLATALESHARLMVSLGDAEASLSSWQALIALDAQAPQSESVARFNAAWLLAQRGDLATARMHVQRAIELDPNNADAKRLLERLGA
jgi:hypothetical protein